jgi:predicted porin
MQSGWIKSNRLGFQGTEDLGGGLTSKFRLESNLDANTGTEGGFFGSSNGGRIFDREAWVSVGSKDMDLKLGRQYHPVFSAYCQVSTTYCMGGGYFNTSTATDWGVNTVGKRWDSMVNLQVFASPMVEANIAYSAGANPLSSSNANTQVTPGASQAGKGSGFNLILKPFNGFTGVIASQSANSTKDVKTLFTVTPSSTGFVAASSGGAASTANTVTATTTASDLTSVATLGDATAALTKITTTLAGASYTTGPWTLRGTLTSAKTDAATPEKLTTTGLGAKYVTGPWELNAFMTSTTNNSALAAVDATKLKATVLWAQYNMSKSTFWYVAFDNTKWDSGFNGAINAVPTAAGTGPVPTANANTSGTASTSINGFVLGLNKSF